MCDPGCHRLHSSRYEARFVIDFIEDTEDRLTPPPVSKWCACCEDDKDTDSGLDSDPDSAWDSDLDITSRKVIPKKSVSMKGLPKIQLAQHLHVCESCITRIAFSTVEAHSPRCALCGSHVTFQTEQSEDSDSDDEGFDRDACDWDLYDWSCSCG